MIIIRNYSFKYPAVLPVPEKKCMPGFFSDGNFWTFDPE
jgi:hypothetical protein